MHLRRTGRRSQSGLSGQSPEIDSTRLSQSLHSSFRHLTFTLWWMPPLPAILLTEATWPTVFLSRPRKCCSLERIA